MVTALQKSIAATSLGGTVMEKLYAISAAGLRRVTLTDSELLLDELSPANLAELLRELGISVSMFRVHGLFGPSAGGSKLVLERVQRKFELMGTLGASVMQVSVPREQAEDDRRAATASQLAILADLARDHDYRVAIDVSDAAPDFPTLRRAANIIRLANRNNLGLVVSNFEFLVSDSTLDDIAQLPPQSIYMALLTDVRTIGDKVSRASRQLRCFPGQGVLDLSSFIVRVLESGYDGPFVLDVPNDDLRASPARLTAMDAMRSLRYVEEQVWRAGKKSAPSISEDIGLAPTPECTKIEFIEFAVSGAEQLRMEGWLGALGFTQAGRHRSKAVTLYRQGEVAIILNAGSDTFAHYYHHLHGLSVCALGIKVDDVQSMLNRADRFAYKRYKERTGPHEYQMPAVRAPDGSLFHLLDDRYDPALDFEMTGVAATLPAEIVRVDHIVRAVPPGQIDSWILFYRALLGLESDEPVDFDDLHGTVRSRAAHDRSNRVRLPLTSSGSDRTVVARSLSAFAGAGVSQIAFATEDVFVTVENLRRAGIPFLRIPAGYYDEIRDERGVPPELVDRMRALDVLYDADSAGGRFLHAYTEMFESRLFFEIVQRTGGYQRYGETNSPVRMAAQAAPRTASGAFAAQQAAIR